MDPGICFLDATELARLIRGRQLSPGEVDPVHLNRMAQLDPVLAGQLQGNPGRLHCTVPADTRPVSVPAPIVAEVTSSLRAAG